MVVFASVGALGARQRLSAASDSHPPPPSDHAVVAGTDELISVFMRFSPIVAVVIAIDHAHEHCFAVPTEAP